MNGRPRFILKVSKGEIWVFTKSDLKKKISFFTHTLAYLHDWVSTFLRERDCVRFKQFSVLNSFSWITPVLGVWPRVNSVPKPSGREGRDGGTRFFLTSIPVWDWAGHGYTPSTSFTFLPFPNRRSISVWTLRSTILYKSFLVYVWTYILTFLQCWSEYLSWNTTGDNLCSKCT